MSAPAFMPGPWSVLADDILMVMAPDGDDEPWHIADICGSCGHETDTSEANARLIAAAPDLLEAAETVLAGLNARIDAACDSGGDSVPVFAGIAALSDAINKARGEQ